jgi:hypothetical protein
MYEFLKKRFPQDVIPFEEYAKGFYEGMQYEFKPFIDTAEARIEMIFSEAYKNGWLSGFPESRNLNKEIYLDGKAFYEYGKEIGRKYKAWGIILQTPALFEKYFPEVERAELK